MRIPVAICIVMIAVLPFVSCKKNASGDEAILNGTWIKGSQPGDTLQFLRRNNKNILRYNISFNSAVAAYTETEYSYRDGKLSLRPFSPVVQDFYPVSSFAWRQLGNQFQVQGIELFSFLASSSLYFIYRKI